MRDFLLKCTRRDNMPLPIPANPCERTFLAVFLYERSPACTKGGDQDESCFLLPPSRRFWSTETMRGFALPVTKSRIPNGIKRKTTSASSRKASAAAGLQASSPYPSRNRQLSKMRHCAAHGWGTRCCTRVMDRLISSRGTLPERHVQACSTLLLPGSSHGVTDQQAQSSSAGPTHVTPPAAVSHLRQSVKPTHPSYLSAEIFNFHAIPTQGFQTQCFTAQTRHSPSTHLTYAPSAPTL